MAPQTSQLKLLAVASACLVSSSDAFSTSSPLLLSQMTPARATRITSTDDSSLTIKQRSLVVGPSNTLASKPSSTSTSLNMAWASEISDFYANCPLQAAVLTCGVKASVADVIAQLKGAEEFSDDDGEDSASATAPNFIVESTDSNNNNNNNQHMMEFNPMESMLENHNEAIENVESAIENLDSRRNFAYIIYGGIFIGLMCHLEYDYAFPFMFARNGVDYAIQQHVPSTIISEILFDNFISGPLLWLPPAYLIKAVIYDYSFKEGLEKYVHDVKENNLLHHYWKIWLPAQTISFSVVPEHFRVVFMASVSFFWFILFSTLASKTDDPDAALATTTAQD